MTRGARNGSAPGGNDAPTAPDERERAREAAYEREVVRVFTNLHQRDPFQRASRPAVSKRPIDPALADAARANSVDADETSDGTGESAVRLARRLPAPPTEAAQREPRAPAARRRGWAGLAERHLATVLAVAGATAALVAPWLWLMAVAVFCLTVGALRSVAADERPVGAAAVATIGRAGQRTGHLLRPRSLVWLPVITARTILAAILLPGFVAAIAWLADHDGDGVFAAVRLAAWETGFRVVAAALCLMMLAGVGPGRARRAELVRRSVSRWPDGAVVALAAGALAVAAVVILAAPRLPGEPFTGADGLGWAPPSARPTVDDVRDEIVDAELKAVGSCLTDRQGVTWSVGYSEDNPLGAPDVARLTLAASATPEPATLVTALVGVDNQLASWVEVIEISVGDTVVVALEREALPRDGVRQDAATLAPGVTIGSDVVAAGIPGFDRRVALVCSAGPVV